ncbi:hypothetical protein RCOM_1865470, partial [Ricinus communis]
SNAIILLHLGLGSSREKLAFFVRDIFTRLQIGGVKFRKKALDSFVRILKEEKSTSLTAKEENIRYLVSLVLDFDNVIQEQAVLAVSLLASTSDEARKIVFE